MSDKPWEWDTPQRNAWLKAIRLEDCSDVEWVREDHTYLVTSASSPGTWYGVYMIEGISNKLPWWERMGCTCPAGESGRPACWHRARVALAWTREAEIA